MILSAGLSPALQQVLVFDTFTLGEVNRARQVHWCASGKVLNVARALHALGAPTTALTVKGGQTGEAVRRDIEKRGVGARWIDSTAPTRVCTTLVISQGASVTEVVPNAPEMTQVERSAFEQTYREEAAKAAIVILIGSLPAGTPESFYRGLLAKTPGKAIIDGRGPELLEALAEKPFVVKPNRQELARTLGRDLDNPTDLAAAMQEIHERGAEWVLITDGPRPAHVWGAGGLYQLRPPTVPVVNPIGCGDSLAAGIAWALWQGHEPLDAFRQGLAVAGAKAGCLLPGDVDTDLVPTLAATVEVVRL